MDILNQLLEQNSRWAEKIAEDNVDFFPSLEKGQSPQVFMIGCSDSRVPINQIVNARPGDIFVHRNIANLVKSSDTNCLSALQYAVESLRVQHIIICGHYDCGGVKAAYNNSATGLVAEWVADLKTTISAHQHWLQDVPKEQRLNCLCELNVFHQVYNVSQLDLIQDSWRSGNDLHIHGWIFSLNNGRLFPAQEPLSEAKNAAERHERALTALESKYCGVQQISIQ